MSTNTTDDRLLRIVLVALAVLVFLPALYMGFGMMGTGSMMGGMWGGPWGEAGTMSGWMVIVAIVSQLLFIILLVGLGYLVYRMITGSTESSDRAIEELRAAYARGDLSDEEYERRRETLERDD